jgi:hypothetical protein
MREMGSDARNADAHVDVVGGTIPVSSSEGGIRVLTGQIGRGSRLKEGDPRLVFGRLEAGRRPADGSEAVSFVKIPLLAKVPEVVEVLFFIVFDEVEASLGLDPPRLGAEAELDPPGHVHLIDRHDNSAAERPGTGLASLHREADPSHATRCRRS